MQSRHVSERQTNLISTDRPDSAQLVDLHVYVIPKKVWKDQQNLAENTAIQQAISAGFVRVPEALTIHDLRRYIVDVCGADEEFPKDWLYLRSVGRCMAKVKQQQEKELKVKNFRPPTTFAPEIYLLEGDQDDHSSSSTHEKEDRSVQRPSISSQSWIRPSQGGEEAFSYPYFTHHFVSVPSSAAKLPPRDLLKVRAEQERLCSRQLDLVHIREEMEEQQENEEQAATTIQTAFRNYRHRQNIKQQQADAIEIQRLEKHAKQLTRRQAEVQYAEEKQAHDVAKLSKRLEELRVKRMDLEANRVLVVRRIQRLQTQIVIRRREEKDLWKKKYFIEKNQTTSIEEQNHSINSIDIDDQLEQAKVQLNNTTKLRQKAEYESHRLRQELHEISSSLNALERYRLPKQRREQQQSEQRSSLHLTSQY